MKTILAILLVGLARLAFGAGPSPNSATIETNGWVMQITFSAGGAATNGAVTNAGLGGFAMGLGTNNTKSDVFSTTVPTMVLSVTSPGYDNTGATNTVVRTLYGTMPVRKAVPNETNFDMSATVVRIALSDYIYAGDVMGTCTVAANWYSNGVSGSFTPVNNSTLSYSCPKVIGNWTQPDFDMIRSNSYKLRWTGGQLYGRNGSPLACVKFVARDAHSHTNTVTVTAPTIDSTLGDAMPVIEWIATMDASGLTAKDFITNDVIAYPWVGTSAAVLDTRAPGIATSFTNGTPWPHSLKFINNKDGSYSTTVAVVGPGGSDVSGRATTNFNQASPPAFFATIGGAATFCKATNNQSFAHNDAGGSTIYLVTTNIAWTLTDDDALSTYLWIASFPTNVTWPSITNGPGSGRTGTLVCLSNINLVVPSAVSFPFFNYKGYWADHSYFGSGSASLFDRGIMYATQCTVSNLGQLFLQAEASQQPWHLIRGCAVHAKVNGWNMHTVVGNDYDDGSTMSGNFMQTGASGNLYEPDYTVLACNRFRNLASSGGSTFILWGGSEVITNGAWIAQNIVEQTGTVGPSVGICPDNAAGNQTNCMVFNNTFQGFWDNLFYNDTGTTAIWNIVCAEKNNHFTARHTKDDRFGTPNGARIGNWSVMYGVACSGNFDMQITNMTASGGFVRDFAGLSTFQPPIIFTSDRYRDSTQMTTNYAKFVTDSSCGSGNNTSGAGLGNYRWQSSSPALIYLPTEWILPFDLEGNYRGGFDPPGAYASASPRKGAGFFGQ